MNFPTRLSATLATTLFATVAFSAAASAGCGSCCCRATVYAPAAPYVEPVDMTRRYIVDQGPVYSGPAITVPVLYYSDSLSAHGHPYVRGTRGYYVRGQGDVFDGGPYADPTSHRRPYYHQRYHHSRTSGAQMIEVRPAARGNVVRARAEVRYSSPDRMEIKLQREQKPRKPRRDDER